MFLHLIFSHNGVGENRTEFTELEKFAKNTFSREVRELNELLDVFRNGYFEGIDPNSKIGMIGHSRGGAVTLFNASKRDDIDAVVTGQQSLKWIVILNDKKKNGEKMVISKF